MKINSSVEMDVDAKEGLLRKNDQINDQDTTATDTMVTKKISEGRKFNKSFLFDRGIF